jgi:hypothetical protein
VLLGYHVAGPHARDGGPQLAVPAGDDLTVAALHGLETQLGDLIGRLLLLDADLGIHQVGALEEFGYVGVDHAHRSRPPADNLSSP